jgi:hypothetical protein
MKNSVSKNAMVKVIPSFFVVETPQVKGEKWHE